MTSILKIDCGLYPLGLLTILTGFGLHMAGHGSNHHVWEACAVVHALVAISLTILLTHHIRPHRAWFKALRQSRLLRKRLTTALLTLLCLLTVLTGIALLAIWGVNTPIGLLHYKIGIGFTLLALLHSVKRISIMRKVLASGS